MQQLIERLFLPAFNNPLLAARHDGSILRVGEQRLAFTTDTYVVRPLFFPGGDIGKLAVHGTVNDLAMCGARPKWLSAGFVIEEGFPMELLKRVTESMQGACRESGVEVVTGDTKVVDRGKCDGLFINTAGVGVLEHAVEVGPSRVVPGDSVVLSGDLGRHGMAVMSAREGLEFESELKSDCASLAAPVMGMLDAGVEIHCLRDLTRGGLASALNEIAAVASVEILIEESEIPVCNAVRGACEILGLDPLYVANEGRFVSFLPSKDLPRALEVLRAHEVSRGARVIGIVGEGRSGTVKLKGGMGTVRILDLLSGEQLPRIC